MTYVGQLYTDSWPRNQTYTVASAPPVAGPVLMPIFRLFLGQCTLYNTRTSICIRESLLGKSSVIEVSKTI